MTLPYNNPIPCATDPSSLSLGVLNNFPQDIQLQIDQSSYEVGLQLGNYVGKSYSCLAPTPEYSMISFISQSTS